MVTDTDKSILEFDFERGIALVQLGEGWDD